MNQEMCDKPVNSFKPANLRLVIGKQLFHYSFIQAKRCIENLKYRLKMSKTRHICAL